MSEVQIEQDAGFEGEAPALEPDGEPTATPDDDDQLEPDGDGDGDTDDFGRIDGPDDDGEQGDEQARQSAALTEQALERLHGQLAKANVAHVAKITRIMGEDAEALIPCPVCMDFVAGLIFPPEVAPLPDAVKERMKQLIGLDSWEDTPNAEWAVQCPDCRGHGEVRTGSFVLGKETTRCLNCGGDGWKNTRNEALNVMPLPAHLSETGPQVYGLEVANDPDVQHLREKGYTVIPPMHATGA